MTRTPFETALDGLVWSCWAVVWVLGMAIVFSLGLPFLLIGWLVGRRRESRDLHPY